MLNTSKAQTLFNKGQKKYQQGRMNEAKKYYKKALKADNNHLDSLYLLGTLYAEKGSFTHAKEYLSKAAKLNPNSYMIQNNLGNVYRKLGELPQAITCFEQAIASKADFMDGRLNYAVTLFEQDDHSANIDIIESQLEQVINNQPDNYSALFTLGKVLVSDYRLEGALQLFERAANSNPQSSDPHIELTYVNAKLGNLEQAIENAQQAIFLAPNSEKAQLAHAYIIDQSGDHKQAVTILGKLIEAGNLNEDVVNLYTSCLMASKPEADKLEQAIELNKQLLPTSHNPELRFNLGKVCEKVERYDESFAYYRDANELKKEYAPFDMEQHDKLISDIKKAYAPENRQQLTYSDNNNDQMVFMVGMPRSGSSLLEQIISTQPQAYSLGENHGIPEIVRSLNNGSIIDTPYPSCAPALDNGHLSQLFDQFMSKLPEEAQQATRITDKMLLNYLHLGLIEQIFPQARIINCLRNPLDTCLSCYSHNFYGELNFTNDLAMLGSYYKKYLDLMEFWKSTLKIPILDVQYEELIKGQESVTRGVLAFCNLEFYPTCLTFYESTRYVNTLSFEQVRKPIYSSAVNRHQHYKHMLQPLEDALADD